MQSNTSSINKDDFSDYSKRPLIMLITLFRVCNMSWCAVVLLSSRILLFFPQTQACACIKINFNCNLNKAAIYSVTVSNCTSERERERIFLRSTLKALLRVYDFLKTFPTNHAATSLPASRSRPARRFRLVGAWNLEPIGRSRCSFGATREWQLEKNKKGRRKICSTHAIAIRRGGWKLSETFRTRFEAPSVRGCTENATFIRLETFASRFVAVRGFTGRASCTTHTFIDIL